MSYSCAILAPVKKLLTELAGYLSLPEKWKEKDVDFIIKKSKFRYFRNKKI